MRGIQDARNAPMLVSVSFKKSRRDKGRFTRVMLPRITVNRKEVNQDLNPALKIPVSWNARRELLEAYKDYFTLPTTIVDVM